MIPDNNKKKGSPLNDGPKMPKFNIYWIYGLIAISLLSARFFQTAPDILTTTELEFKQVMLSGGDVEKIDLIQNKELVRVYIKPDSIDKDFYVQKLKRKIDKSKIKGVPLFEFSVTDWNSFNERLQKFYEQKNIQEVPQNAVKEGEWFGPIANTIFSLVLIVVVWILLMRKMGGGSGSGGGPGGIFNVGKSKATLFEKGGTKVNITFADVAGLEEAKEEVMEIVDFLKQPKKYTALGGKIPKGALLVGPPGTGKTLLAKAMAGEAQVPFFSLSGSDFVEMFVGVGASRVRDLFKQAREKAPCIIFIDEIDAIGRARGKNNGFNSNDERENTLNQLLTEMDGFGTNSGVIILAATNRADVLDSALLRAGRFDRQIYVDMPDLNERKEIFQVHLKPLKLEEGLDIDFLARQTPGFSGADIANLCNEAALIAARKEKKKVSKQDFLDAVDRIVGGLEKKNKIITLDEKKTIAFHEAGHATISWLLEFANPLVKVTIVPRGQSLGAAWYLPEERQITTTGNDL